MNVKKFNNKNIYWLASYPKSGNTLLRLFLSLYFFTEDGIIKDFNVINNISSLNNYKVYKLLKEIPLLDSFIKKPEIISKYWIDVQKKIIELHPKKIFFFKTHNAKIKYNSFNFTNNLITAGFVYIVRDPRSVLLSTMDHYGHKTHEEALTFLLSDKHITYVKGGLMPEFILSWKSHLTSWKNFLSENNTLGLIIRYEDMIQSPKDTFLKILLFFKNKIDFELDLVKFNNACDSVNFKKLKNLENKISFSEKSKGAKNFFRKGISDEWKNILSRNIIKKIEINFKDEMKNFNYI